jgi:hypothetical protein
MLAMISRMVSAPCLSEIIRIAPQRSHSMRRNHEGKARSGSSRASAAGSGSMP